VAKENPLDELKKEKNLLPSPLHISPSNEIDIYP